MNALAVLSNSSLSSASQPLLCLSLSHALYLLCSTAPHISLLRSVVNFSSMQALRAASAVRRAAVSAASAAPAPARAYSRRPQNLAETTYHLLFKRNFTYYTFVVAGAIILESVYGWVGDSLWASLNEGVREAHVKLVSILLPSAFVVSAHVHERWIVGKRGLPKLSMAGTAVTASAGWLVWPAP